jgi:cyclopropane-fatty-acyl-phospholipid synthase
MSLVLPPDLNSLAPEGHAFGRGLGIASVVLQRIFSSMEYGRLIVVLPNGARVDCRGRAPWPEAIVVLRNMRALRRLFFSGDVAFDRRTRGGHYGILGAGRR